MHEHRRPASLPGRVPVGRGDGRLPDRGAPDADGKGRRSGTRSATRPGRSSTATPATSPATATTATRRTSRCCSGSASAPTGSASPGRGSSRTAGAGQPAGLDYYNRLVDGLLEQGHHAGGHPVPLGPAAGAAGQGRLGGPGHRRDLRRLRGDRGRSVGDRVHRWITLNEPWVVAHVGYRDGRHAPGVQDPAKAVAANHHLLLAHGRAVTALRATSPSPAQVGITLNLAVIRPVSPEAADVADELDARHNRAYLGPLLRGAYPERLTADFSPAKVPGLVHDGDFDLITTPMDFLGVNFYAPQYVGIRPGRGAAPRRAAHRAEPGARAAGGDAGHGDELAGRLQRDLRADDAGARRDRRAAAVHHRERVGLVRLRHPGRHRARTTSAWITCAITSPRCTRPSPTA